MLRFMLTRDSNDDDDDKLMMIGETEFYHLRFFPENTSGTYLLNP